MKTFLHTLWLMFMMVTYTSCSSPQKTETSAQTVKEQIQKGAMLVDVRTPSEFADGSAPGAVNIPLDEIPSRVEEFKGQSGVVVFCRSGNRSSQAKEILEKNGIKNVTNGINAENVQTQMK